MTATHQGIRFTTKTSSNTTLDASGNRTHHPPAGPACSLQQNVIHVDTTHIHKLYTDDTGRFPIRSHSGNECIMVAYHQPTNAILVEPSRSRRDVHRITAYNNIMKRIHDNQHHVDLQLLDNEASTAYKNTIKTKWNTTYQLVPPYSHRRNAAERAIRTFKAHFLVILAGVDRSYPRQYWDLLLPQAELTLNLLRQSNLYPNISAHQQLYNSPFSYNAHPLGPIGATVLVHNKPAVRHTWDFRCQKGWYLGTSLEHYRCHRVLKADTSAPTFPTQSPSTGTSPVHPPALLQGCPNNHLP